MASTELSTLTCLLVHLFKHRSNTVLMSVHASIRMSVHTSVHMSVHRLCRPQARSFMGSAVHRWIPETDKHPYEFRVSVYDEFIKGTARFQAKKRAGPCDLTTAVFELKDDNSRGAKSEISAKLSLPPGANASLIAVPLDSTVHIGKGLTNEREVSATLPSTGAWSVELTIGTETCEQSSEMSVVCLDGFVDDGAGSCICPDNKQNIEGRCVTVSTPCQRAKWDFQLENDAEQGSQSRVVASLTLPKGANASISAAPLDSTVQLPLQPSGQVARRTDSSVVGKWAAVGSLSTTGEWQIGLTIDGEQCTVPSQTVMCMPGFVDDGTGRCECPAGSQNVDGVCQTVQSACGLALASFTLADDPELGSRSRLVSKLSLPAGAARASVTAVPLDATVSAGSNLTDQWKGNATLPSTGEWRISLAIGTETCSAKSTEFNVPCMDGFVKDATGRCNCPEGKENRHGVCQPAPCGAGKYLPSTDSLECVPCIFGHFCPLNLTAPSPCPRGSYRATEGGVSAADCAVCPRAQYGDSRGASACTRCPDGHSSRESSMAINNCTQAFEVFPNAFKEIVVTPEQAVKTDTLHVINTGVHAFSYRLQPWDGPFEFVRAAKFRSSFDAPWHETSIETVEAGMHLQVLLEFTYTAVMNQSSAVHASSTVVVKDERPIASSMAVRTPVMVELKPAPGKANALLSEVQQGVSNNFMLGSKVTFTLVTYDSYGRKRNEPSEKNAVSVKLFVDGSRRRAEELCTDQCDTAPLCCVRDMSNGEYSIEIIPTTVTRYEFDATLNGQMVGGRQSFQAMKNDKLSLCDLSSASFTLEADAALGSLGRLTANLSVPNGTEASLTAIPLDSTVSVELERSKTGIDKWQGEGRLPTTGNWSVSLAVGGEQCTKLMKPVAVRCIGDLGLDGPVDDGTGRCECPPGTENQDGICIPLTRMPDCPRGTAAEKKDNGAWVCLGCKEGMYGLQRNETKCYPCVLSKLKCLGFAHLAPKPGQWLIEPYFETCISRHTRDDMLAARSQAFYSNLSEVVNGTTSSVSQVAGFNCSGVLLSSPDDVLALADQTNSLDGVDGPAGVVACPGRDVACPNPGGMMSCALGYWGPACARCMDGFAWSEGHVCTLCKPQPAYLKYLLIALVLVVGACVYYNCAAAPLFNTDEGGLGKRLLNWFKRRRAIRWILRHRAQNAVVNDGSSIWDELGGGFFQTVDLLKDKFSTIKGMGRCCISFLQVIGGLGGIRMEWPSVFFLYLGACQRQMPRGVCRSEGTQRHVSSRPFRLYPRGPWQPLGVCCRYVANVKDPHSGHRTFPAS